MAEIIDITLLSADKVKDLLEKHGKPLLCLVPWERIEFIQSRVATDPALVSEYSDSLNNGDKLPPSKGIFVHERNICKGYDGIHTATARNTLGQTLIPVLLQLGTDTDADVAAAGANYSNGARRTNEDKHNAVAILIRNPQIAGRSTNWLARIAKVSPKMIEDVRIALENDPVNPVFRSRKRRVVRNGVEYEIDAPAAKTTSTVTAAMDPEKTLQRIVGYIAKQVENQPIEERAILCERVVATLKREYFLDQYVS